MLKRLVFVLVLFSTSVMSLVSAKLTEKGKLEEYFVVEAPIPEVKILEILTFSIENIIKIYEEAEIEKNQEELLDHFKQVEQQIEDVQHSINAIASDIKDLRDILTKFLYFTNKNNILNCLDSYWSYVKKPEDKVLQTDFSACALHLPNDIRTLMKGLLGKGDDEDLMNAIKDGLKCHGRQLKEKINSLMGIVMSGIWLHNEYRQIINTTDFDNSPFPEQNFTYTNEFVKLAINLTERLDKEVFKCQMDERSIANEMSVLIKDSSKQGRKNVGETLLHFLDDKYDTKKWIVVVSPETGDSTNVYAVQSKGFHRATANGMFATAISFDPAPELSNQINAHMKSFKFPIESRYEIKIGYSLREKTSARDVYDYLNRYLSPLRTNRSEVVIETLVFETPCTPSVKKFKDFVIVMSSNDTEYVVLNNNGSCVNHLVMIVPVRPFNSSGVLQDLECYHEGIQNGLLRNEFGQAYLSVLNDSSEEGAFIVLDREWRNRTGQRWRFVNNQLMNDHGKCLTSWVLTSLYVYQYDCHSDWTGQFWYRQGLNIVNGFNLCLAYKGTKDDPIMYLVQAQCDSTAPFLWYDWDVDCEDAMILPSIGNASRPLKNEFSRRFLTVYEGGFYAFNEPWNNEAGQNWQFVDRKLRNDNGKCLIGKGNYVLQTDCPLKPDPKSLWTYNEKQQIVSDEAYCLSTGDPGGYIRYNYCKDDPEFRWV